MKQEEVLQALDEIIPYLQNKQKWTTDEVSAMYVETYRNYTTVAQLQKVEISTISRRCIRVINKFK
jgi:hypothetical protein